MNKPCRTCEDADFFGRGGSRKWCRKQLSCEAFQKYRQYLEAKKRYVPGPVITTAEELDKCRLVYWAGVVRSIAFIRNQQYGLVVSRLESGCFRQAIPKADVAKQEEEK